MNKVKTRLVVDMDIGKSLDHHCTHVRVCARKRRPLKDPNLAGLGLDLGLRTRACQCLNGIFSLSMLRLRLMTNIIYFKI